MNGNNVYVPHSQAEHPTTMDQVFFDNPLPQMEAFQSRVVSIMVKINQDLSHRITVKLNSSTFNFCFYSHFYV